MKTLTNRSNAQQGFTLIELVVVIVILGILAATAAPKFIDLTSDAKKSVMKGVEGSIESAVSMVHAKAILASKTKGAATVSIDSVDYAVVNGYPSAIDVTGTGAGKGILSLVDLDSDDFTPTAGVGAVTIQYKGAATGACQLVYTNSASANARPIITNTSLTSC
jgi:MSHA pilin protein MshA